MGGVCRLLSEKSSVHLNHFRVRAPFKLHDHVLALLSQLRVGSGYARYEGVPNINSLIFEIRVGPATWPAVILLRGPKEALCTPRDRAGGRGVTFRREVHSAGNLVPQGPSGTCGVGRMRRRGRVPDGLQIGRLTRHETPLALPLALARRSQATKIARPNRFARPFGSIRPQPRRLVIENLSKRHDHRPRQIRGSKFAR